MSFSIGLVNTIIILVWLALSPLIAHFIDVDYILMHFWYSSFLKNFLSFQICLLKMLYIEKMEVKKKN